jgi:hypothetical protein
MTGAEKAHGSAAEAAATAAVIALQKYNAAIGKTSDLLDEQGRTLQNLDQVRQRYHDAELERTKSLAYHYEKAKQFLTELQEDTNDTSTVLGTFTRGWRDGIDNMLRYGKLPEASQQIREIGIDFDDVTGSIARSAGAISDNMAAAWDQAPAINQLRENMVALDVEMVALEERYTLAENAGRELGQQIVKLAAIDIGGGSGAVKQVAKLADQLTVLNQIAGVTAEDGMQFAIERSQQVGGSMADALVELERFSAMADIVKKNLEGSGISMTRFASVVREDFVRAMMEARRMLKGQTVDLERVGAAFQWASQQAIKYGSSAEAAGEFSKAFGKMVFGGGETGQITAQSMLAGRRTLATLRPMVQAQEERLGKSYEEMSDDERASAGRRILEQTGEKGQGEGGAFTREQLGGLDRILRIRDQGGLAPGQAQAMASTMQLGMRSSLEALTEDLRLGSLNESTLGELLRRKDPSMTVATSLRMAQQLREGNIEQVMGEITELREEAATAAAEADPRAALGAVLAMKDPVQELFAIKNLVKALVLNVDTIVNSLEAMDITGTIARIRGRTEERAEIEERGSTLAGEQEEINERLVAASEAFAAAATDEERAAANETIASIMQEMGDNLNAQGDVAQRLADSDNEPLIPVPDVGTIVRDSVVDMVTDTITDALPDVPGPSDFVDSVRGLISSGPEEETTAGPSVISAATQAAPGSRRRPVATLGPSPEGAMDANGDGTVTVGTDGQSIMNVRMVISNMEEVVSAANTKLQEAVSNFF